MRFIILLSVVLAVSSHASAQNVLVDSVLPRTTDNTINTYNLRHYIFKSDGAAKNTLVVFIPGTFREPHDYKYMMEQIALLGYHVIGLGYKYDPAINPVCRPTDDVTCHWRARMETVDGVNRHTSVSVDAPNSILNRLLKGIQYFANKYPSAGWSQFYSGSQLQWDKIIVTGHSQGAALAGIIGMEFPVKRVVMLSMMDFLNSGNIPNWVDNSSKHGIFYEFTHSKDELVPFTKVQLGCDKLGLTQHGSAVSIDCNTYPFNNTHILYTTYFPSTSQVDKFHNGTTIDSYIDDETNYKVSLKEAIRYLFKD